MPQQDDDLDVSDDSLGVGKREPPTLRTLRRAPELHSIPFEKLDIPPIEDDPQFTRHYVNFVTGRDPASVTRLPRSCIQLGFRRPGEQSLIVDDVSAEELALSRALIRAGARPVLYVYHLADVPNHYACSDDAMNFMGYTAERISMIPCVVLGEPPVVSPHAALNVRMVGEQTDSSLVVEALSPPTEPRLFRIVGDTIEKEAIGPRDVLGEVRGALLRIHRKLQRFHVREVPATHYHYSLASALTRAIRMVDAIRRIGVEARPDVAAVVVRALYELWLSLYVDWIAPEIVGPVFQIHASSTHQQRKTALAEIGNRLRKKGWPESDIRAFQAGRQRMFRLADSPSERARINPGAALHSKIYPRLCRYAHQDFAAASPFLVSLDDPVSPARIRSPHAELEARFLAQVIDIAAGGVVSCVAADIGDVHPH